MLTDLILTGRTGHPLLPGLKKYRYAHRGFHDKPLIPENSLAAFSRAVSRGFGAELDVHLLKDGTLAVFHDSDLKRCTGKDGTIEDLDFERLSKLRLEGTGEHVPLLDEVLELFDGKTPLIIELKTYRDNHRALAETVCARLDRYAGLFCIESFDPRAVADVRDLRPDIVRGQLTQDFFRDPENLPLYQQVILRNLLLNVKARPDFIACRFEDRKMWAVRRAVDHLGLQEVCWTIRSKADLETAESAGAIPIFERFDPEN